MACLGKLVELPSSVPQKRHCCAGSLQSWLNPRLIACTSTLCSMPSVRLLNREPDGLSGRSQTQAAHVTLTHF